MRNVIKVFEHLRCRTFTEAGLITDIREWLDDGDCCYNANKLVRDLTDCEVKFDDNLYARIFAKKLVQLIYRNSFVVEEDIDELVERMHIETCEFVNDPKWSFLKSVADEDSPVKAQTVQIVEGIDLKVAVKVNEKGEQKIKKGGKQVLAAELFKKYVLDAAEAVSNSEFIKILMKELNMTKAGANTYSYNLRKEHGLIRA